MNKGRFGVVLPPLVLTLVLSLFYLLPGQKELQDAAISPELPVDFEHPGWYGVKQQESEKERAALAGDTVFSKAEYSKLRQFLFDKQLPPVHVSIVYSGSDMNASIHRPERCLPSQGHVNLKASDSSVRLSNGRDIPFTRLASRVPLQNAPGQYMEHINYYVFIGRDRICAKHLKRTLYDIWDRTVMGVAQRWAYYQIGTCWGESIGISEDEAEAQIRQLISELTPGLVNWDAITE